MSPRSESQEPEALGSAAGRYVASGDIPTRWLSHLAVAATKAADQRRLIVCHVVALRLAKVALDVDAVVALRADPVLGADRDVRGLEELLLLLALIGGKRVIVPPLRGSPPALEPVSQPHLAARPVRSRPVLLTEDVCQDRRGEEEGNLQQREHGADRERRLVRRSHEHETNRVETRCKNH